MFQLWDNISQSTCLNPLFFLWDCTKLLDNSAWSSCICSTPALLKQFRYLYIYMHVFSALYQPVSFLLCLGFFPPIRPYRLTLYHVSSLAHGEEWDLCFVGSMTGILNTIMWPDSLRSTTDSGPCGGKVVIVSAMLSYWLRLGQTLSMREAAPQNRYRQIKRLQYRQRETNISQSPNMCLLMWPRFFPILWKAGDVDYSADSLD